MLPNTAGLQEYTTEELLIELTRRAKLDQVRLHAVSGLYDDYLSGRQKEDKIINKMYDLIRRTA